MKQNHARVITINGILLALALILSYVEMQIPPFFAIPGMKLGLTNVVVLFALFGRNEKSAVAISVVRVLLVALLFGNAAALLYSLFGAVFSLIVMIGLKKTNRFGIVAISVAGGVFHNIGQIVAAMLLMRSTAILWYLVALWFAGIASGCMIGIAGGILCRYMRPHLLKDGV